MSIIVFVPLFIDFPELTFVELKTLIVGEKVRAGYLPAAGLVDTTAPLTAWFYSLTDIVFGKNLFVRHLLGLIVVFVEAILIGTIFINRKVFGENTYIPSLLFIILASFSFDSITLSGDLMASFFLLLGLSHLFRELEFHTQRDENVFMLGIQLSLATLFAISYTAFFPGVCLILIIYSRRNLQSILLLLTGFLLPHALLICFYFIKGRVAQLVSYYYYGGIFENSISYISTQSMVCLFLVPVFFLLLAFVVLSRESRFTKYQSQLVQVMFLWILISIAQVMLANELRPQSLLPIIPCLAFFITHYFLVFRRKRFAEINFWVFAVGIISTSYLARYNFIENYISYSPLLVPSKSIYQGEKILLLKDDVSVLRNNKLATGFLDWKLSSDIFLHPEYYENVILVNGAFEKDSPQIIVDPDNLLSPYLERIPRLKNSYKKEGDKYFLISN